MNTETKLNKTIGLFFLGGIAITVVGVIGTYGWPGVIAAGVGMIALAVYFALE